MTTGLDLSEIAYTGNGATVDFPVTFPWVDDSEIAVTQLLNGGTVASTLVDGVDYTLVKSGVTADEPGGTGGVCTFAAAAADLSTVTITRTVPVTQDTNFRTAGPFSPSAHMAALDKLTRICQQLERRIASLEALGTLLDISALTAARVDVSFATSDPVEKTFDGGSLTVTMPVGFVPSMVIVGKVTGGAGGQEEVQVRDWSADGTTLTLGFITGLEPSVNYDIELLLLSIAVA